jgi:AraC family transcriptional regulator
MRVTTRSYYEQAVTDAMADLISDLDAAIDLGVLASRAAASSFHFHRIFRGMVGETPLSLSRRLKLERAAWVLTNTDQSVLDVAFSAGYETHESFTRAFRAAYSTSPSGFRVRSYPRIELAATCGIHFDPRGIDLSVVTLRKGEADMDVDIIDMPELRLAALRHLGPYNQITTTFERLGSIAGPAGVFDRPDTMLLAVYHDDPEVTPQDELRSDAALTIDEDQAIPDGAEELRIPAGTFARHTHIGPYEHLGDVWARFLGVWLPQSGHSIGPGGTYEIYRNTLGEVEPDELITDLYLAIGEAL